MIGEAWTFNAIVSNVIGFITNQCYYVFVNTTVDIDGDDYWVI